MAGRVAEDGASTATTQDGPLADAAKRVKEMEDLEDYYFGANKEVRMKQTGDAAILLVDNVLADAAAPSQTLRISALYLKGRVASLIEGQERVAEELLSKALKLNPQYLEAWNALGEVYWNLQDFPQAKQCFEQAIELCGANSVSLRNLSMVLRALDGAPDADDSVAKERQSANFTEALKKAKAALALDIQDPQNWETLGNAHMGDFFVNGKGFEDINRALVAYNKAESAYEKLGKQNPTLQLNRGRAAKYIEEYSVALKSFQKAMSLGAGGAMAEEASIVDLMSKLNSYAEQKKTVKRLKELTGDMPKEPGYCSLRDLRAGKGGGALLIAKAGTIIERNEQVPVIVGCYDSAGDFFALSLYNAELSSVAGAITPLKSLLQIKQPKLRQIEVDGPNGKRWAYSCVRVAHPSDVQVIGGSSLGYAAAQSVFSTHAERGSELTRPILADEPEQEVQEKGHAEEVAEVVSEVAPAEIPPDAAPLAQEKAEISPRQSQAENPVAAKAPADEKVTKVRAGVAKAIIAGLHKLVDAELGDGAGQRIGRVEQMYERIGSGEVRTTGSGGERYAPGFVEGLGPDAAFHDPSTMPWCAGLTARWRDIRDELQRNLEDDAAWKAGAYAESNQAYAPDWRIAEVFTEDRWQDTKRWKTTTEVVKSLSVRPFEVFFARMLPQSKVAPHSDNLNYVLTSSLGLICEPETCAIAVGDQERFWKEGDLLVFDTSYIHSAKNDGGSARYVLIMRFWHPQLTQAERLAIHLSHAMLAATKS